MAPWGSTHSWAVPLLNQAGRCDAAVKATVKSAIFEQNKTFGWNISWALYTISAHSTQHSEKDDSHDRSCPECDLEGKGKPDHFFQQIFKIDQTYKPDSCGTLDNSLANLSKQLFWQESVWKEINISQVQLILTQTTFVWQKYQTFFSDRIQMDKTDMLFFWSWTTAFLCKPQNGQKMTSYFCHWRGRGN